LQKIYDFIIVGAGPAGITAAVYAARNGLDFLVITLDIGGQAALSGDIENYTGYQFISGPELALKFQQHMDAFDIKVNMPEKAKDISRQKDLIKVITDKGEYICRSLVIATGKRPRPLGIEGEREFKNRGVTYCAICDGPLFKGKNVAIIGGGNSALDAALEMVKISPYVYIINIAETLTGDRVMVEKLRGFQNVEVWNKAKVKNIYGTNFVGGIEVEKEGRVSKLKVQGVFVEIGLIPNSEFASLLSRNQNNEIIVDCHNKTNVEGVFAAGDVTNVPQKQIIVACGEGAKAALSSFRYLSTHNFS